MNETRWKLGRYVYNVYTVAYSRRIPHVDKHQESERYDCAENGFRHSTQISINGSQVAVLLLQYHTHTHTHTHTNTRTRTHAHGTQIRTYNRINGSYHSGCGDDGNDVPYQLERKRSRHYCNRRHVVFPRQHPLQTGRPIIACGSIDYCPSPSPITFNYY
jgi:hypothetical protein